MCSHSKRYKSKNEIYETSQNKSLWWTLNETEIVRAYKEEDHRCLSEEVGEIGIDRRKEK